MLDAASKASQSSLTVRFVSARGAQQGRFRDMSELYIFGYGSLISRVSRLSTVASITDAAPVVVKGISRGWFDQWGPTDSPSWSPTWLGAVADVNATCNGVLFPVTPAEFDAFNKREAGYVPTMIDASGITMLDGNLSPPEADVWFYATRQRKWPTEEQPIVQSYVDECLTGCLEVEAEYPLAKSAGFARQFIETTSNWQTPWVNDRIYPWRPYIYLPQAFTIDALLLEVLGRDLLDRIKLPGS